MANLYYSPEDSVKNIEFDVREYVIGGKLVSVRYSIDPMTLEQAPKYFIKQKMADQLANYMIEKNLIEFTKQTSAIDNMVYIHARCYLAPGDQVKILREYKR